MFQPDEPPAPGIPAASRRILPLAEWLVLVRAREARWFAEVRALTRAGRSRKMPSDSSRG